MTDSEPSASLDSRFSSSDAIAASWTEAVAVLKSAEIFWLSTVRPDGRPHVTPLIAVWLDDTLYFCTGPDERKAKNLVQNNHCALTTGCNTFAHRLDLVLEGDATPVRDDATLQRVADRYEQKYEGWHFTVQDGAFTGDGGKAEVYAVNPRTVFGFAKGESFGQTRWQFP